MNNLKINKLADQMLSKRELKKVVGGDNCIIIITCSTSGSDTTSNKVGYSTKSFPKIPPIAKDTLSGTGTQIQL